MIYQLINDSESSFVVKRIDSNGLISFIPKDEASSHYQEYLEWLDEGNTPEPAEEAE